MNENNRFIDSNNFLNFIFKNSEEIIWILNSDYKTISISPAIEKLTGYKELEYLNLSLCKKFTKKTLDAFKHIVFTSKKEKIEDEIIQYIRKDGSIVNTKITAEIFYSNNGDFMGAYGITKDITEEERLEYELNIEKQKNIDARKFTSNVLGVLGHEFRTPLNGMLGFIQALIKRNEKDFEGKEMLNYIEQSTQRLNATLNSLITLVAIESQLLQLIKVEIDMFELITRIQTSFESIVKQKNINFKIFIDERLNTVITDEDCLYQIVYHLVDNAVKFTENGNIEFEIANYNIDEKYYIIIKVTDSGIGIDDSRFEIIFEPFRQLSEGTDRKYEGLGIGLTIVKKLVEKLNGTIKIQSQLFAGSEFTVYLPIN